MSKEIDKVIEALENISIKFDELGFSPTIPIPKGDKTHFVDWFKDEVKTIKDESSKQEKTISDLEAKLAESEKSKESFKVMYFNKCLDYEHLHEKFDDKCAEFELKEYDYKQTIFEKNQDKISFAVEQLKKVKEWVINYSDLKGQNWNNTLNYLNNQIQQLKEI